MPAYKLHEGSLTQRFFNSRAKIKAYGGGFANGKTAASVIAALQLARDYPGSNGLIARSTYPKLNDTIRKEFLKWCPVSWIKSFPRSQNGSNTCTLTNGTEINFRYISQQGKNTGEATTTNLLSATYDWAIVDQIEDPGIVHKDFLDLLGRLRGSARYVGKDPTMPSSGPRWLIITMNPSRGWVYKKLIQPLQAFNRGIIHQDLICERDESGQIVFDKSGNPRLLIELFEGSTYENAANLEPDFIRTLEATYTGQMRERFLLGKWAAYEGLVYSEFSQDIHLISHNRMLDYWRELNATHKSITNIEGFDFGIAVPSCYIYGFCDGDGNVMLLDGFYKPEMSIEDISAEILRIRLEYGTDDNKVWSDPDIFRRKTTTKKTVGKSVADMMHSEGIFCVRGNSDITNGIVKVKQYLTPQRFHRNPFTKQAGAPHLYVSEKLEFFVDEINSYYWQKDANSELSDLPMDKDDHAMDTLKYMLSERPTVAVLINKHPKIFNMPTNWTESPDKKEDSRRYRYG
jgi:hypothetical protein